MVCPYVLPRLLLLRTGDQMKLLATRSYIHGIFCCSSSCAENQWVLLSLSHTSGFQCCLCGAKELLVALFLKDTTANQPERANYLCR